MLDYMPQLAEPKHDNQRIAFYGPMASGKSWCANYLYDKHSYTKVAFARKLKLVAEDLFGIKDKSGSNRKLLQDLGTNLRSLDPDIWIKHLLLSIEDDQFVVLDDLRYINEAKVLKNHGFTLVLANCPEAVRLERVSRLYPDTTKAMMSHPSELEYLDIAESEENLRGVDCFDPTSAARDLETMLYTGAGTFIYANSPSW